MTEKNPKPDPVEVTIPLVVTVDPAAYAAEYGDGLYDTPEGYAEETVRELLDEMPKHIRPILQITVGDVSQPRMSRLHGLESEILTATQEWLERLLPAADFQAAVGVVYPAREYENGWYVVPNGARAYFTDLRPAFVASFDYEATGAADALDRLLTDYVGGPRGPESAVAVNVLTGAVEFDAVGKGRMTADFRGLGTDVAREDADKQR